MNEINWDEVDREEESIPPMFICPLTNAVMMDPVVDPSAGLTYERSAIVEQRPSLRLVPNLALKELIRNYMGDDWVQRRDEEAGDAAPQDHHMQPAEHHCLNQERVIKFLDGIEPNLTLDQSGECVFAHDNMLITVNVPQGKDLLILYVCPLVSAVTPETRNKMLRLNFMQAETFGGWLSLRRSEQGSDEVMFSFAIPVSDLTDEVYFKSVLQNFSAWAFRLRIELWDETKVGEEEKMNYPSPNEVQQL